MLSLLFFPALGAFGLALYTKLTAGLVLLAVDARLRAMGVPGRPRGAATILRKATT
jgi:hypothetical protein